MDEQQLVTLARDGDTVAFGELTRMYKNPILRYLYRLTGDIDQAYKLWKMDVNRYESNGS